MDANEIITKTDLRGAILEIVEKVTTNINSKSIPPLPLQTKYYRAKDLKLIFGLSENKIRSMRTKHEIPFTKLGGIILYPVQEIEKLLKRNSNYNS